MEGFIDVTPDVFDKGRSRRTGEPTLFAPGAQHKHKANRFGTTQTNQQDKWLR
jgi:hypothetical protein